jgi:hypothetical protein
VPVLDIGSANNNKTIHMIIQGEFRGFQRKLQISNEGPSLETSKFSLYFSGSCIPSSHVKV